jgi:hypothetical protein
MKLLLFPYYSMSSEIFLIEAYDNYNGFSYLNFIFSQKMFHNLKDYFVTKSTLG